MSVVTRLASANDSRDLAELRHEWSPPTEPVSPAERREFEVFLDQWMRAQSDRVICAIAMLGEHPVGMAWLAVFERVPNPASRLRRCGDLQSVYVRPALRGRGIGTRLVRLLLEEATRRSITPITVHSSDDAIPFYRRLGFDGSGGVLTYGAP